MKPLFYASFIFPLSGAQAFICSYLNQITVFLLQNLCCWYLRMPVLYISKGEERYISNISAVLHLLQSIIDKRHSMNSLEVLTNG